jgi:hypothetical protein
VARIAELPHGVDPSYLGVRTHTVTSRVVAVQGDFLEGPEVPIWILLLAILAGLIFLALLSFVLWRFGFFNRRRHQVKILAAWIKLGEKNTNRKINFAY